MSKTFIIFTVSGVQLSEVTTVPCQVYLTLVVKGLIGCFVFFLLRVFIRFIMKIACCDVFETHDQTKSIFVLEGINES